MCGIAGIYKFNKATVGLNEIKTFTDAMFHRGPDGSGYELLYDSSLALGHRRLSILDLSELGKQPMHFADRYWITFNGEVFNFLEIRDELINKGILFKTETDTEVVLAAYLTWGKDAFMKFNGMWAIAIWDDADKKLLLCRDRFGVKPLHYVLQPNNFFAFASETIAFKSLQGFDKKVNNEHLLFSIHQPSSLEPTGETIYQNIKQLLPGHFLEINSDYQITETCWWNTFEHLPQVPQTFEKQKEEFFNLFENACKIRLRSDVPIASALSGGLDSSSVFGMVHHLSKNNSEYSRMPNNWKRAVVATFPNTPVDEKHFADEVIQFLKAEAIYTEPNYSNLVTDIVSTTKLFDSISGTPIISVTDVYKAMRNNGITVSLDGHGGDELLFGYKSSILDLFNFYLEKENYTKAEALAITFSKMGDVNSISKTKDRLFNAIEQHKKRSMFSKIKQKLFNSKANSKTLKTSKSSHWFNDQAYSNLQPNQILKNISTDNNNPEYLLWNDFFVQHIPYNLRDFDRGAMQHGIEIRMPLMDYRLVSYCFALPTDSKVNKGYTKYILRESMKGLMPESIRLRTNKIGLGAPTTHWFNNQLNEFICDEVSSKSFLDTNIWNGEAIKKDVLTLSKEKLWTDATANQFWNVLNAHIILNK